MCCVDEEISKPVQEAGCDCIFKTGLELELLDMSQIQVWGHETDAKKHLTYVMLWLSLEKAVGESSLDLCGPARVRRVTPEWTAAVRWEESWPDPSVVEWRVSDDRCRKGWVLALSVLRMSLNCALFCLQYSGMYNGTQKVKDISHLYICTFCI